MPEEHLVAKLSDIPPNEIKQVRAGPTNILLVNLNNTLHATEPLCPHYKQPLADGLICGNELRCGWHQSVFDIATGHVCEPPALDDLKKYPVRLDGADIYVDVASYRTDRRRFVIIGGGAAGYTAATTLRENGFTGELTILSSDTHAPYDRPNLSKDFLAGNPLDTPLPLRDGSFYKEQKIDLRLNSTATAIDRVARTVSIGDSSAIPYDTLLIATGGRPRTLQVAGSNLAGVHTLRSLDDATRLIAAAEKFKQVTIVGGSFIAMESAAALRQRGLDVTIVIRDSQPLAHVLGDEIGRMIRHVHESHGVTIYSSQTVNRFEGDVHGHVQSVVLVDGTKLDCDLAVIAIGVDPITDFLRSSLGEFIDDDGGVRVDAHLKVCDQIYAAGDIARLPLNGSPVRIEHWRFAEQLGRLAAMNMLGIATTFDEVPYFWTYQYDLGLDYIGHAEEWDEIIIDGDVEKQDFLAYYIKAGRVTAVCCCGRSKQACAVVELMRRNAMPAVSEVVRAGFDFIHLF